jgi:hypothetical protein
VKRGAWLAAVLVLAAVAGHGCAKRSAPDAAEPPGDASAPAAGAEPEPETAAKAIEEPLPDDIAVIEDRLSRVEDELASVGVRQTGDASGEPLEFDADADRCTRICNLAEAICDLEGKICDLAEAHEGDERYAKACERADGDCERATKACTACVG